LLDLLEPLPDLLDPLLDFESDPQDPLEDLLDEPFPDLPDPLLDLDEDSLKLPQYGVKKSSGGGGTPHEPQPRLRSSFVLAAVKDVAAASIVKVYFMVGVLQEQI
jgi:hypothetical protein